MNEFFQNHIIGLIFFLLPCIVPIVICLIYGLCKHDFKFCSNESSDWDYHQFDTEAGPELEPTSSMVAILLPGKNPQVEDPNKTETEEFFEDDVLYSPNEESMDLVRQKAKELEKVLEPDG